MRFALATTFKLWPCAQSTWNGPHAAPTKTPAFFASRTIFACTSTEQLRWMMPRPPSLPSAIAMRASVTRSIAAERKGSESANPPMFVLSDASPGSMALAAGLMSTSSKVNPSALTLKPIFYYTPFCILCKVDMLVCLTYHRPERAVVSQSRYHLDIGNRIARRAEKAVHHVRQLAGPMQCAVYARRVAGGHVVFIVPRERVEDFPSPRRVKIPGQNKFAGCVQSPEYFPHVFPLKFSRLALGRPREMRGHYSESDSFFLCVANGERAIGHAVCFRLIEVRIRNALGTAMVVKNVFLSHRQSREYADTENRGNAVSQLSCHGTIKIRGAAERFRETRNVLLVQLLDSGDIGHLSFEKRQH